MVDAGLRAVLTCLDPKQCDERFVGHSFDAALLAQLPPTVDPCGERGEFHTFCTDGPMFTGPVEVRTGVVVRRDGFCFVDLEANVLRNGVGALRPFTNHGAHEGELARKQRSGASIAVLTVGFRARHATVTRLR
jgi:hypothetical protein